MLPAGTLQIKSADQLMNRYTENMGAVNLPALLSTDTQLAAATQIDTFARGIISLSTNTYEDSTITFSFDINSILAEGGE